MNKYAHIKHLYILANLIWLAYNVLKLVFHVMKKYVQGAMKVLNSIRMEIA